MKDKLLLTAEELLLDERFLSWVASFDNHADNQWIKSLITYSTEQEDEVADAVSLYHSLRLQTSLSPGLAFQKQRLLSQLDLIEGQSQTKKYSKSFFIIAALIGIWLTVGIWMFLSSDYFTEKIVGASTGGQTLSDGTVVKLSANSTITVSPDFDRASRREVWVKGEVEFSVKKKQDKKPFIVHMDPFDVLVTGTVFQAINIPNKASVLLREGTVQLIFKDGQILRMAPGDYYAYNRPVLTSIEQPELLQESPILERKIVFENLAIEEVAKHIELRYPVKIVIASAELAARRITGILPNDNLDVLLNALEIATESVSNRQGSTIVFTPL
jgi:transmembrane sensor